MALLGKKLQVMDVYDLLYVTTDANGKKKTLFNGQATKTGLEQKVDGVEIKGGIGGQRLSVLRSTKQLSLSASFAQFDLDFLASINGVDVDKTSTDTYYIAQTVAVATNSATVSGAKRIISVKKNDGTSFDLVTGTPTAGQAKVVYTTGATPSATLTFDATMTDTSVSVSYVGAVATGKDNLTIVFNSKAMPKTGEIIMKSVVYDQDTEIVVANVSMDFYKCALDANFNMSFDLGKAVETEIKLDILCPDLLPDGTVNSNRDYGRMVVTEI